MEAELFLIVPSLYCTLAMEQKIVLLSTFLHIFSSVVLTELCLRNNVCLIMFLLYKSNISIVLISCDYDGLMFFWSCSTFWKNFSFPLIIFVTTILGFTSCASALLFLGRSTILSMLIHWSRLLLLFQVSLGFCFVDVCFCLVSCFIFFFQTKHHLFFSSRFILY